VEVVRLRDWTGGINGDAVSPWEEPERDWEWMGIDYSAVSVMRKGLYAHQERDRSPVGGDYKSKGAIAVKPRIKI
jgi:hypothetical protein